MRYAVVFHVEGLREDGMPIPVLASQVEYIEVAAQGFSRLARTPKVVHLGE